MNIATHTRVFATGRSSHVAFMSFTAVPRPSVNAAQKRFNLPTASHVAPSAFRNCRNFTASSHSHGKVTIKVPQMAESIHEGTLVSLHAQVGTWIDADSELGDIETDKVNVPITCPVAGKIVEVMVAAGDLVKVGQEVAIMETEGGTNSDNRAREPEGEAEAHESNQKQGPVLERSGGFTEQPARLQQLNSVSQLMENRAEPRSNEKGERVVRASRMRLAIARNLKEAQNLCASTTTYQDIDMKPLIEWRQQHRGAISDDYGVRLGYMGAFTKAAALAASEVPEITAWLDIDKEQITYRDFTNIAIAVSTSKGLVTPVIRNCECLSVVEIEKQVAAAASKARDGKLVMQDFDGGHFSISNPGIFGSLYGTPLIPLGQVATFNMNSIRDRVVPFNGKIEIRPQMIVSLTYDHRLIDGLQAVKFLTLVKSYIQDPSQLPLR